MFINFYMIFLRGLLHWYLWLDEEIISAEKYRRNYEDFTNNFFGIDLVKIWSYQEQIIHKGIMKWSNSNHMTCIHRIGISVVHYVVFDIYISNQT